MEYLQKLFNELDHLCDKWEPYFEIYERHFSKFRGTSLRILEIGVYKGGSAELWKKYFGKDTFIVGVDINPECKQYENEANGLMIQIGDASDPNFWLNQISPYEKFDIIIDDGGHHMKQQKVALEEGWKYLNNNGIFLIEDIHTSYWDHWPDAGLKNPNSFVEHAKNLVDVLTEEHQFKGPDGEKFTPKTRIDPNYPRDIKSIHFYNSVVVFEKGIQPEFKRVFSRQPEQKPVESNDSGILTIRTGNHNV